LFDALSEAEVLNLVKYLRTVSGPKQAGR